MFCCHFDTYASIMVWSYEIHLLTTLKSFVHSIWECEKEFFPSELLSYCQVSSWPWFTLDVNARKLSFH